MRLKFILSFVFYTLLFLFYPGDSYYFHIFAYYRNLFNQPTKKTVLKIKPVPYLKNPFFLPEISAQGVYVIDFPSFTPLYEKNSQEKFIPASTTKIITALVAYDIYKPEKIISVKKTITEGQLMNLQVGEKITVENLLYGLLIHSANDAAFVLADNYGYQKFIQLMNQKASKLKMKNTHFVDPAGLEEQNQYSTPFDLSLASRELLKNHYLAKIVSIKEITISDIDFKYFHHLTNINKLLGEVAGLGGVKTGYTQNAGENLISFYKKNGHQYIIVVLKSEDRFEDTKNILRWLEENVVYLYL
ncbi:MAG: serine hydrolase [Patescibacteria group bacterium]|nr:serine hydrolase [Patescibacteria group bacterium]